MDDLGEGYVRIAKAGSVVDNQIFNISAQGNINKERTKRKRQELTLKNR